MPCFIRFDIKGASHFTVDGLNYFILFVCSAVLPGPHKAAPARAAAPPRAAAACPTAPRRAHLRLPSPALRRAMLT